MVLLVVLHDDRCAILRNNEMIHEAGGDAEGIDEAVHRFMTMTQVSDVLGGEEADAPTPAEARDSDRARVPELTRRDPLPARELASSNALLADPSPAPVQRP